MKKEELKVGDLLGVVIKKVPALVRVGDLSAPAKNPAMFVAQLVCDEEGVTDQKIFVHPSSIKLNYGKVLGKPEILWPDFLKQLAQEKEGRKNVKPAKAATKAPPAAKPAPAAKAPAAVDPDSETFQQALVIEDLTHELVCAHFNGIGREMQIAFSKGERLSLDNALSAFQTAIGNYNKARGL